VKRLEIVSKFGKDKGQQSPQFFTEDLLTNLRKPMKKQLKFTILTMSTVVGTTAGLISFPMTVLANSMTNTTTDRSNLTNTIRASKLSGCQTNQTTEPNNNLSQVHGFCDNEIFKNLQDSLPSQEVATSSEQGWATSSTLRSTEPIKIADRKGMASWYGPGFHGSRTASGESFNAFALTAAHPYLPFGTRVRVTNLRNGKSVVVRINDRGPHTRGRIIDLSKGAASVIGLFRSGVAPVLLEIIGR
jgi:rare lipoprotein A